ncbi:MAG: BolA family protein [Marinomonas foliarum]|jgi:BolA family transcriptional regulator, general stress-responsive regulator|uniref:BolA family transcriptional regulator n=1 Tax=Marinomonas foliarum TaxID=491950 RepID=A0A368ZKF0_9GAMM|nr:BolA/IbaG family iron-sulfur metabolism protein [Marinomonas foliarum]QRV24092.1 BolA family transcriptional regulator [Marinomonas foliarum]RCW94396.1 BolA protein family transcriptional regulator [Marinomonas foliarum]
MIVQNQINTRINENLDVQHMTLENESHMHNVPEGSESHFKLVLVSDAFEGKRLVQRHQLVYATLKEEMSMIHALAMHLYSTKEWRERNALAPSSPKCHGGE